MNAEDEIVAFIEAEKVELRKNFHHVKQEIDGLLEQVREREKVLASIKGKLAYNDDLIAKRQRASNPSRNGSTPSLPQLGRFANSGPAEAVRLLFETDPDQELSTAEIVSLLAREGFQSKAENLPATIFTTCKRLHLEEDFLSSRMKGNVRMFWKKKKPV